MHLVVTIFLILTTCNTWTGVCSEPEKQQWTVPIFDTGPSSREQVARAIEDCRVKGVKRAYQLTGVFDPFGEKHGSTNVHCEFEIGSGI